MAVYDENPSSQKIKKRVLKKEEVIEELTREFCANSGCLDNMILVDKAAERFLRCTTENNPLNVYVKKVDLKSCILDQKSEGPGIKHQKHFDVIIPELHDFLMLHQSYFGIDSQYIPISRNYMRDENSIRSTLEINYL